jgi:hypothetical protein
LASFGSRRSKSRRTESRVWRRTQTTAVLLGVRLRGEARGALGLVGEIGMRPDQRYQHFLRRAIDHRLHRGEQLVDAGERPQHGCLLSDPWRVFKDICQRRGEIVLAANV